MSDSMDLGGGGNSFKFDVAGASVTGVIKSIVEVQQTDVSTGKPAIWQDGKPKMMFHVELDNGTEDGASVYIRGAKKPESMSSLAAVVGAVKAATGGSAISKGATLTLTYVGDGAKTNAAFSAPKRYTAVYVAPSVNLAPAVAAPASNPQYDALIAAGVSPDAAKLALGL